MSDEALRGSERRWRGAGGEDELARLVAARVRAGSLPGEAAGFADRLAAGSASVEDALLLALVGLPWARELLAEPLAEACAYHALEAALEVEDGAPSGAWLQALRAIGGRAALGVAFGAVASRGRGQVTDPHDERHAGWLRRVDDALEALDAWLSGDPAKEPLKKVQRLAGWRYTSGDDEVERLRRLVGHAVAALLADPEQLARELDGWLVEARELVRPDHLVGTIRAAFVARHLGGPT